MTTLFRNLLVLTLLLGAGAGCLRSSEPLAPLAHAEDPSEYAALIQGRWKVVAYHGELAPAIDAERIVVTENRLRSYSRSGEMISENAYVYEDRKITVSPAVVGIYVKEVSAAELVLRFTKYEVNSPQLMGEAGFLDLLLRRE